MFTLKFINIYEDPSYEGYEEVITSVSCPHYSAYKRRDGSYEISLYKDFTSTDGVCYFLSSCDLGRPYYQSCYVENLQGKTIEAFRPTNNPIVKS